MGQKGVSKTDYSKQYQTETLESFINRFNTFIDKTNKELEAVAFSDKETDPLGFYLIPISAIINEMCGLYSPNWRRDFLKKGVVEGSLKLHAILKFWSWEEMMLTNTLMRFKRGKNSNGIGLVINQYFNKQMTAESFDLEENQTVKDSIHITLDSATGKLGLNNGDKNK